MGSGELFSFALIGDTQYAEKDGDWGGRNRTQSKQMLPELLREFQTQTPEFLMVLGDIGDGITPNEIPEIQKIYEQSNYPIRYAAGNHDFVLHTETELCRLFGVDSLFYDFAVANWRFIVINSLDVSRFSPPGSERLEQSLRFRRERDYLKLRDWDGMLSENSKQWLKRKLDAAQQAAEPVILISHVPIFPEASAENAWMWDHAELLDLLDEYPNLKAVFSGHYHPGGIALRNGVLHKTVKSMTNTELPTGCVVRVFPDRLELKGFGEEHDFVHRFDVTTAEISGSAPVGAYIMTDTGELTQADRNGRFSLTVAAPGIYSLKAVADGMADAFVPMLRAPADSVNIPMTSEPGRRVIHGFSRRKAPALLHITDDGVPVRWFDLDGKPFGGAPDEHNAWHEHSRNFWTLGEYAFSARGIVENDEVPYHPEVRELGYYKGDFHAHIIHGENIYRGNLQLFAFAARAEGYDWLYSARNFSNDKEPTDFHTLSGRLSSEHFLCMLNSEFPKNGIGHCGNVGVKPIYVAADQDKVTNLELAEEFVVKRGGIAIPVHILYNDGIVHDDSGRSYSNMTHNEVFLWLLCAPEHCPCLDIFYNRDTPGALAYYRMLLDKGYRIGVTATSDASFDVGRTPGSDRGSTFVRMNTLSETELLHGIQDRSTVVSWENTVLLLEIDGQGAGKILPTGKKNRLTVRIYGRAKKHVTLKIFQSGRMEENEETVLPESGYLIKEQPLEVSGNGYVFGALTDESGNILSVSSAIYFRNETFVPPEVLPFPNPFPEDLREYLKYLDIQALSDERTMDFIAEKLRLSNHSAKIKTH